ncbi:MAG: DNA polymerase III subunit epsilon [Pseudomonadota bacterium]
MREIVLDTETTGIDPFDGHRIVEIGCVELENHLPTGRTYHQYINPKRSMPMEAERVHGLSEAFLSDKPEFPAIADGFLTFIDEAPLVIHNAKFDMRFLNAELDWMGRTTLPDERAIDTLMLARKKFPGAQASLDALCKRFQVDNSGRDLHGALIDADLLAQVYLELIGGRQPTLMNGMDDQGSGAENAKAWVAPARPRALPSRLTPEDIAAHKAFVEAELGSACLWLSSET